MRKMIIFSFVLALAFMASSSHVMAVQDVQYDRGRIMNDRYFDGFWCSTVLPRLRSDWSYGMEHKLNHEFWFSINDDTKEWVEMGFHNGYGYNIDGTVNDRVSYEGLFVAAYNNGIWSLTPYPSYGWHPGQYHTMGTVIRKSLPGTMYADMRTDNQVIQSYRISSLPSGKAARISVGMEFGIEKNEIAIQFADSATAKPITIDNLNVHNSSGWHKWSELSSLLTLDDGFTNMKPSYNYYYNQLLFERGK